MKSITIERNNDLLRNALSIVAASRGGRSALTMQSLISRALACRPQHFYYSYNSARRLIRQYREHGAASFTSEEKAAEIEEIMQHVSRAMGRNRRMRIADALTFVLHFCRPSRFYISDDTATRIIRRHFTTGIVCTDAHAMPYSTAE